MKITFELIILINGNTDFSLYERTVLTDCHVWRLSSLISNAYPFSLLPPSSSGLTHCKDILVLVVPEDFKSRGALGAFSTGLHTTISEASPGSDWPA